MITRLVLTLNVICGLAGGQLFAEDVTAYWFGSYASVIFASLKGTVHWEILEKNTVPQETEPNEHIYVSHDLIMSILANVVLVGKMKIYLLFHTQ